MPNSTFQSHRGQLSLEFLLIFAVFLSVIGIFLMSFTKIKTQTENSLDQTLVNKFGNDLAYTINSLCVLGDGNKRELMPISGSNFSLICNQDIITVSSHGQNITYSVNCNTECSNLTNNGNIKIENKNGTVFVS